MSLRTEILTNTNDISDVLQQQWRLLESSVSSPNVYLSVDYLLPLITYVENSIDILFVAAWLRQDTGEKLIGLGVFQKNVKGFFDFISRKLFPQVKSLSSDFIFQSGLLLHDQHARLAFKQIAQGLKSYGITSFSLHNCPKLDFLDEVDTGVPQGLRSLVLDTKKRMILSPQQAGINYLDKNLSRSRKKKIRRKLRQLDAQGEFAWSVVRSGDISNHTIDAFLRLEHCGWKGDGGTSLLSDPGRKQFFEQAIKALAQRDSVFFTEISLSGEVVASTCNLIAGDVGFAFKLGWDLAYSKQSIGFINEYLLVESAPTELSNLRYIDSGAEYHSFLNQLWTENLDLHNYLFTSNKFVYLFYSCVSKLRSLRNKIKN